MRLSSDGVGVRSVRRPLRWRAASALLLSLGIALPIGGCKPFGQAAASSNEPVVTVGVVPGIDNATLYLAKKKGFFAQAGINVRIVNFTSVSTELQALAKDTVNVAAGDYGDLFAKQSILQKNAYKIIADGYDAAAGVVQIMTMPTSPAKSAAALAGRVIAAPKANLVQPPLRGAPRSLLIASATSVLQSYGANMSGVIWKTMSPQQEISELTHGQVAAALLIEPYVYQAQQAGAYELVDACSGATAGIPLSGYFTSTSWARDRAKEVAAFRAGLAKADAEASMPGPVQAVLPSYAKLTSQEAALVTTGVYPLKTVTANVQRTADLMFFVGMIRKQLNVAKMIARLRPGLPTAVAIRFALRIGSESQLASDDHLLHLRGALADLKHLGIAIEPGDRELVDVAVAAEDLSRVACIVHRGIRGRQLGDRGLDLEWLAGDYSGGRVIPGQPGQGRPGLHFSDLEPDGLVMPEVVAERRPLSDIPHALVDAALGQAGRERRDRDPAFVEYLQELGITAALLTEQVRRRNSAVVQRQLSGV